MLQIRAFDPSDEVAIITLWRRCDLLRPWNDPSEDIRRKSSFQPEGFLVGLCDDELVASVMAGYDGHRGWIYYLAVHPEHQGSGYGTQLVDAAVAVLATMGCPKVNLQVRRGNEKASAFYRQNGFVEDRVTSFGKRLVEED